MIFNIFEKKDLLENLPIYEFKNETQIAAKKLIIEWKNPSQKILGLISSNLVDKNSVNPRQQLCTFSKQEGEYVTDIEFANPIFYNIQLYYLHDATITIQSLFNDFHSYPTNRSRI